VRLLSSPPLPTSHTPGGPSPGIGDGAGAARLRISADAAALFAFCALAILAEWQLLKDGTVIGMDTATGFYPWYAHLGEQLRDGHIPMWNPYQFAGTPFAGDPESGWAYLPAMVLFTVLPLAAAADSFMSFHVLLAGLSTYALARSLGVPSIGALVSAIAYGFSGFFFGHNICCFAYSTVAAWLPLGLLGIERALRATTWRARVGWWTCGGLAVSQLLAAWIGQGAYYAILFLGAYLLYRTLTTTRFGFGQAPRLAVHGIALLGVGFGLAAIGVLPRLEYNAVSNLPGGYAAGGIVSPTAALSDWGIIEDWQTRLLVPGFHYAGLTCLGLALLAPFTARFRFGVPFFFCMSIAVLVLARWQPTPLHVDLSILPGFGPMHMHAPERALIVWFICPALLAGATVGWCQKFGRLGVALALGLAALVLVDLRWAWSVQLNDAHDAVGAYQLQQVDMEEYYASTPGAVFIRSATASDEARSIGYAQHVFGGPMPYTLRWTDPKISALNVNNRAVIAGLNDIQGYNPIHLARLEPFMRELNGRTQEYHQNDVLESGLYSPLLDLLGVRYIVMPVVPAADQVEPRVSRDLPIVYADADVKVLENADALPRAWIVHHAEQMDDDDALTRIAGGALDPRRVVALEETPPPADEGRDTSSDDQVAIVEYSPETVRLRVQTSTAGMLILSDLIYPAWHARVDDSPAKIYVADSALRAVAVPPGEHTLEFQYTSAALPVGAAITGLTVLLLVAAAIGLKRPW
jgi:hypothetical protein